jgi:hypothetical protein
MNSATLMSSLRPTENEGAPFYGEVRTQTAKEFNRSGVGLLSDCVEDAVANNSAYFIERFPKFDGALSPVSLFVMPLNTVHGSRVSDAEKDQHHLLMPMQWI